MALTCGGGGTISPLAEEFFTKTQHMKQLVNHRLESKKTNNNL